MSKRQARESRKQKRGRFHLDPGFFLITIAMLVVGLVVMMVSSGKSKNDYSSKAIADFVSGLPRTSYGGHVRWNGVWEYGKRDEKGSAVWRYEGSSVTITKVIIPVVGDPEREKVYWLKEVSGTLWALEWYGSHSLELPQDESFNVLVDGLGVLWLEQDQQKIIGAVYVDDPYFNGRYIQWKDGLTCEQIYAVHLMSLNGQIAPGGVASVGIKFNCPFNFK